ncbi:triose-phosphate isomerase [Candidatus Omnitrophota bacterium]
MRKLFIAGNWKMNQLVSEAIELTNGLKRNLYDVSEIDIAICPTFVCLSDVNEVLSESNIKLGSQDVYWEEKGAFTGEISSQMLKDVGCTYAIIGHSERRQFFSETNQTVNKKVKAALVSGLIPIMCVGERLEEREKGKAFEVVQSQIQESLEGVQIENALQLVIAYEPVWAIGTGKTATPQQAQEVHHFIRGLLVKIFGDSLAAGIRIQYGGSVKPENAAELMGQEDIDGALVGGASLKVDSFTALIKNSLTKKE